MTQTTPDHHQQSIENTLHIVLPELRQRYGLRDLWLFGSYIRGEASEQSDLDVLVTFDNQKLSLLEFIQLEQELSDLLQVKVDLVERDTLKSTIGAEIMREAIAI